MTLLPTMPNSEKIQQWPTWIRQGKHIGLIGLFLVGLFIPMLGVFTSNPDEDIKKWEKRRAEQFPEVHYKKVAFLSRPDTRSIRHFPRQFEKWFNDHLGLRRPLIQLYQKARYFGWTPSMLSSSQANSGLASIGIGRHRKAENQAGDIHLGGNKSLNNGPPVHVGKDGWLFLGEESCINEYRGVNLMTQEELEHFKKIYLERRDWLAKRGIHYVCLIAPNKHTIYGEYVPDSLQKVSELSRLQQLNEYLKSETDLAIVDLVTPLIKAKSWQRLYHKTDTHWNACGAFIGYREVMKAIQQWYPELRISTFEDYDVRSYTAEVFNGVRTNENPIWTNGTPHCDLAHLLAAPVPYQEEILELVPNRNELQVPIIVPHPPLNDEQRFRRYQSPHGQLSKVLVIHDSFFRPMAEFLSPHCQEVTYYWGGWIPTAEVDANPPVVVIDETVQRSLGGKLSNPPEIVQEMRAPN